MTVQIGTPEAAKLLIKELYIDLRNKVNKWSSITKQTPQARMGYVGQHLVSVVTGFPGGRSGARGHDIELSEGKYAEIKTCYKVDQLGHCKDCGCAVSSIETLCSECGSSNIERKDDSKWLISIRNDEEFEKILDPELYYFVLFDFEDIEDSSNDNIIASIWEVDPKTKGFAFCMFDYYLNIRSKSDSKAPFNMWPYQIKFQLCCPKLIFRCRIDGDEVSILHFPNETKEELVIDELCSYSSTKTITKEAVREAIKRFSGELLTIQDKKKLLNRLQMIREELNISNEELCDVLSEVIYVPLLSPVLDKIPLRYRKNYPELN